MQPFHARTHSRVFLGLFYPCTTVVGCLAKEMNKVKKRRMRESKRMEPPKMKKKIHLQLIPFQF